MTTITITTFNNRKGNYGRAAAYKASANPAERLSNITDFIDACTAQLYVGQGPSGISMAEWQGSENSKANFVASHGLLLDYTADKEEELVEAMQRLGFAHFFLDSENKAKTVNAVTLCIPFSAPTSASVYERIASCIVTELGVYGLMDGALAATHVVDIHATTKCRAGRGQIMDPEAFKRKTKDMYQGMNARKFHKTHAPARAADVHLNSPYMTSEDGLWEMPVSVADLIVMRSQARIEGRDLTQFGRLL